MTRPRFRAAALDGFTIVLDLIFDEYIAVPQEDVGIDDRVQEAAESLNASPSEVLMIDSTAFPRATLDLGSAPQWASARPVLADGIRLLCALPKSLWALRFGRPLTWLRDEAAPFPEVTGATIDAARRFKAMRPFIPWLSRCLPHALLLRSFLSLCGHSSTLVIGVRLFPFEAHSWVQAGDVVLTDDLDLVGAYTIIAAG